MHTMYMNQLTEICGGAPVAFSLLPDFCCDSIYDIDPQALKRRGVSLLLADLDNTLISYGETLPNESLRQFVQTLKEAGITLFLLSNSRKPVRPKRFAEALGIPYLGHAGKPKTAGYLRAMEQMGRSKHETMMVGDQIFTDVLGAKRTGIPVILVKPIQLAGNPGRYLRYAAELPMRTIKKGSRL